MNNRKAITLPELLVIIILIPIITLLVMAILPGLLNPPRGRMRLVCGTNLKGMGTAMAVYAFDYRDEYPIQGAGTHTWGATTTDWNKPDKDWKKSKGTLTVASSLYLLVREADVGTKSFNCSHGDGDQTPFEYEGLNDIVELWDFGANPGDHQSYAYQYPYGKFPPDATANPGNAIMADRNPWFDKKLTHTTIKNATSETFTDKVSLIDILLDNERWRYRIGNSQPHDREGQNVLFNDGHVDFVKRPDVGTRYDNIYTIGGQIEAEKRIGTPPTTKKIDARSREDSLLVNDR
jgi:hypothetical protein